MQRHLHRIRHWLTQPPSRQHFCRYVVIWTALSSWASGILLGHFLFIRGDIIVNYNRILCISTNTSIGPSCNWKHSELPNDVNLHIHLFHICLFLLSLFTNCHLATPIFSLHMFTPSLLTTAHYLFRTLNTHSVNSTDHHGLPHTQTYTECRPCKFSLFTSLRPFCF